MPALLLDALLVGYIPGALLYRMPGRSRAMRAGLPAEERAFWGVVLSVAWSLAVVLVLAGVGQYTFGRLLGLNAGLSAVLLIAFRRRLLFHGTAAKPSWAAVVPAGLVALGLWLYFPPAEYVIGGRDPGTYINEGIQIAQRGGIVIRDPVIESVPRPFWDLFFPSHQEPWYYGIRFMGFFIHDPDGGEVIGQFPHLYPASIAIGYGVNGLSGARQASGVWAILGLLSVYFVGARLFGRVPATAAALLLGIHVTQVWFARYPNTEVVMQALLFAALLAFARALEGSQRFFGSIAAALLGVMLFLRYDIVLAFASVTAAALLAPVTRQRVGFVFPAVFVVTGAAGFWYLQGPMQAYSYYPLGFTRDQVGWGVLAAGLLLGLGARLLLRRDALAVFVRRALPLVLAIGLVLLAGYAYFLRQPGGGLAEADALAFRTFAWYLGPWVLGLAVLATAAAVLRRFWQHPAFFLTFAAFSVFFFYKMRIVPEHFWAMRRLLAITLPGALLFLAALADQVTSLLRIRRVAPPDVPGRGRWVPAVAGSACVALLLGPVAYRFWRATEPVRHHVEYAGLIPKMEELAARIGPEDLLVVEARDASDLHAIAMPLAYIYARQVLVLNSAAPSKATFEAFLAWAETQYRGVLFLGGGGTDLLTRRMRAVPVGGDRFQVPEYDAPHHAYPEGARQKEFEYGLYRLALGGEDTRAAMDLSVGVQDDLNVVRFHAREKRSEPEMTYRWTTDQSFVVLNPIPAAPGTVTIWMSSGGRPPQAAAPIVEVAIDDEPIGTAVPVDEVRPYSFDIPEILATRMGAAREPVRLRLRVPTWNPAALLGVPDSRDLGVVVTRIEVQ